MSTEPTSDPEPQTSRPAPDSSIWPPFFWLEKTSWNGQLFGAVQDSFGVSIASFLLKHLWTKHEQKQEPSVREAVAQIFKFRAAFNNLHTPHSPCPKGPLGPAWASPPLSLFGSGVDRVEPEPP